MSNEATKRLVEHYASIADSYDAMFVHRGDEHDVALNLISSYLNVLRIKNVLDVGCGTGGEQKHFLDNHPSIYAIGVDISFELLKSGVKSQVPQNRIVCSDTAHLPLKDDSVDAVVSLGLLHHVPDPNHVVAEMMRVASKAVFISDNNRYGIGSILKRLTKLGLYKLLRMGKLVDYIRTRGKMYMYSEGSEGVFYSYGVFDSIAILRRTAKKVLTIPTKRIGDLSTVSILKCSHFLICAFKEVIS